MYEFEPCGGSDAGAARALTPTGTFTLSAPDGLRRPDRRRDADQRHNVRRSGQPARGRSTSTAGRSDDHRLSGTAAPGAVSYSYTLRARRSPTLRQSDQASDVLHRWWSPTTTVRLDSAAVDDHHHRRMPEAENDATRWAEDAATQSAGNVLANDLARERAARRQRRRRLRQPGSYDGEPTARCSSTLATAATAIR